MTDIKPGDLIYRIWPSGHKTLALAIGWKFVRHRSESYIPTTEWNHIISLERYHDGNNLQAMVGSTYSLGTEKQFRYELIPEGSFWWWHYTTELKDIIDRLKR